ncbi:N-acetylmuramoyl-L-alanine amidase [Candidatus Oleimmundimicrobium sp.]|uniref:N-acetylmuramoyl-L-alanine amidase family protein n=1 Tax=Candidatus Oleimmundimicrobium sp. TaxID=3060597 RepID=UPI002721C5BB|nr:N-acetylmuramoyl-L-alanine amidase [Candidatus Oleimmundimicrobium sp.]MDO8885764.1 N-acetylmuramoyl-L-alanine amidase [Candidatus Oleimmundimicrobium sp.]
MIGIDAGHHNSDSGAVRVSKGIKEVDLNRAVIKFLKQELAQRGIIYIECIGSIHQKANIANANNCSIYVSVHHNAGGGEGTETFHCPNSSEGAKLAKAIHSEVVKVSGLKDRGIKQKKFTVLTKTKMPATLIELGFMDSNDFDEIIKTDFQNRCAGAICRGICNYFGVDKQEVDMESCVYTDNDVDARIGSYLSEKKGIPLIVNSLPAFTSNKVYAIGLNAVTKCKGKFKVVVELSGKDRFETAKKVMGEI